MRWALSCIHLGMEAEWPEALLGCELGEEVEVPSLAATSPFAAGACPIPLGLGC